MHGAFQHDKPLCFLQDAFGHPKQGLPRRASLPTRHATAGARLSCMPWAPASLSQASNPEPSRFLLYLNNRATTTTSPFVM